LRLEQALFQRFFWSQILKIEISTGIEFAQTLLGQGSASDAGSLS
jgi:hypothetical protein